VLERTQEKIERKKEKEEIMRWEVVKERSLYVVSNFLLHKKCIMLDASMIIA